MAMPKLILTMSLPIMFSMMISALYNIVDSMFVARWSEDALQAVSLAFPVQTLVIAVATGTGVGMNSLLSKSLGEKDYEKANKAAHNTIFVCGLSYLVFALFAVLFSETFFPFLSLFQSLTEISQYHCPEGKIFQFCEVLRLKQQSLSFPPVLPPGFLQLCTVQTIHLL